MVDKNLTVIKHLYNYVEFNSYMLGSCSSFIILNKENNTIIIIPIRGNSTNFANDSV